MHTAKEKAHSYSCCTSTNCTSVMTFWQLVHFIPSAAKSYAHGLRRFVICFVGETTESNKHPIVDICPTRKRGMSATTNRKGSIG
jgi:hypothetical protein